MFRQNDKMLYLWVSLESRGALMSKGGFILALRSKDFKESFN